MASHIVTSQFATHCGNQIVESISEHSNNAYYFFTANHLPQQNGIPQITQSNQDVVTECYKNMIQGKRISNSDCAMVVRNIPYVTATVYDMYDDQDSTLFDKDFFVIVDEGSYSHVYKCLDNNRDAQSTFQPTFSHVTGSNTSVYQTADGYRWKYMYSVSADDVTKFSTSDFFPVFANTEVSNGVVRGAVDIIKVEGIGQGYDNYLSGTFSTSNIRVGGNSILYEISNTSANPANGFYTGCLLYLSTGTGSGQYANVDHYFSNNSGKYVIISEPFNISPTNGTQYQLDPNVVVYGSGAQTTDVVARALVNSVASNSIYRVEVLNRGANYDYIISSNVIANSTVDVDLESEVRAIISPWPGHGYSSAEELGSTNIAITVKISNNESNTLLTTNDFQQIGIIKDPLFCNVAIELANTAGNFVVDEYVHKVKPIRINSNCTINTTSSIISCSGAEFDTQLQAGEYLLIRDSTNTNFQLSTVNSVTNSSQITIAVNGYFSCTECSVCRTELYGTGYLISANGTYIIATDLSGQFETGDYIVGSYSGAYAQVNSTSRSNVTKGFDTFIQLYKYISTAGVGTYQQNETVYQLAIDTSNASLHSVVVDGSNTIIYTSNQNGAFLQDSPFNLIGANSSATYSIDDKYYPELIPHSGTVMFIENIEPVTKTANSSETFQMIINFK